MATIRTKKRSYNDFIDAVFVVNGEMIKDNGEDSFSYCVKENIGYVSVFDGCGGIGSRKYDEFDGKTGAYIASRACAGAAYEFFEEISGMDVLVSQNTYPKICEELEEVFYRKLSSIDNSTKKSAIKGSLTKNFPTTMSGILFKYDNKRYTSFFTWAGDSRGFILAPRGLTQITKDDVSGNEDAFTNLSNDGNLQNYISADGKFVLNHKSLAHDRGVVLITATDGCFGYFTTPMEFEYMLLNTLIHSSSINEWKQNLSEYILKYTGDDYTMGIVVIGFGNFKKLKRALIKRHKILYKRYIERLENVSKNDLHDMWRDYKKVYYRKYGTK